MAATLQSDGSSGKSGGSPRNTSGNSQSGQVTKAVRLAPVEVSKPLQAGEKFMKWQSYEVSYGFCYLEFKFTNFGAIFIDFDWNRTKFGLLV